VALARGEGRGSWHQQVCLMAGFENFVLYAFPATWPDVMQIRAMEGPRFEIPKQPWHPDTLLAYIQVISQPSSKTFAGNGNVLQVATPQQPDIIMYGNVLHAKPMRHFNV